MITKKDQEMLLERINFLDSVIDLSDEDCMRLWNISKTEAIQNNINNLKHIVCDLR